jgi:hypothetical protein
MRSRKWTVRRVGELIERECRVRYCAAGAWGVLRGMGWRWRGGGRGWNGKQVRYAYGITDQRDTLLLVLSPTCHACEYNWPNWTQMIRKLNGQKTRLLIANIAAGSALTTDYLAKHQVAADNVIAEVSAESIQAYKLGYTPQTILIAPDGKVVRVHTGMLKEGDLDVHGAAAPPQNSKVQSSGFEGVLALSIFLGAFELG